MGTTIVLILLALVFIVSAVVWFITSRHLDDAQERYESRDADKDPKNEYYAGRAVHPILKTIDELKMTRLISMGATGVSLLLLLVIGGFSCTTVVPTKEIGIKLTLSKPSGNLTNGFHWKAPWQEVKTIDAAVQTDNHVPHGETSDGSEKLSCITVRIAHQTNACIWTSVRWQVLEPKAGELYQNYRDFSKVRDSLVTRDLTTALAAEFETYDPLAVNPDTGQSSAPAFSDLAGKVVSDMNTANGGLVNVLSVYVQSVQFDGSTNSKIQAIQSQIAATQVAKQAEQTAIAQSAANKALAQSVNNNPGVLQQKCLDTTEKIVNDGGSLPATWNCGFGGSGSGLLLNVPGTTAKK